jgi:hypothetical protein
MGATMARRDNVSVEAVTAGVDWISATLGREELENQTWLYNAIHALEQVAMQGNVYKRHSLLGFDGWGSGNCFVGSNTTMHYAQFSGRYAQDAYTYLEHPKVHISRIDLQITIQYSEELLKEGRYQYARAIYHNKALPEHRRRKIDIIIGSSGGDTVYMGSASSPMRGRIYNKDIQSGDEAFKRSWRYEAVYRNKNADRVYRCVTNASDAINTIIVPTVIEFFRERGVNILGVEHIGGNVIQMEKSAPTDVDRKLRWIRNQVVPTIRKLAELGYAEELMECIAEAISAARHDS